MLRSAQRLPTRPAPAPIAQDWDAERRNCAECRASFVVKRSDQAFCSSACNAAANTRESKRARAIYRALYWWRYDRSGGFGANMRFVCREVSAWIREDRAAQRPPPPPHNHDSNRGHEREKQGVKL